MCGKVENTEYLTMKQIEIHLKCYYLKNYTRVAANENMTPGIIKKIKEKAFRIIRLAYSRSRLKGLRFDGKNVLNYMAEQTGMETVALLSIFETYIEKGMTSDNKKYWVRIRGKGSVPTPAELLDFIYDKYEIEIEGFI